MYTIGGHIYDPSGDYTIRLEFDEAYAALLPESSLTFHIAEDGTNDFAFTALGGTGIYRVETSYTVDRTMLSFYLYGVAPAGTNGFTATVSMTDAYGYTGAGSDTGDITGVEPALKVYDFADGKIRYDGININKIRKPDLRRSLGVVLQDVNLFTGTVMENIRYGRLDATDEECIAAARLANADGFIKRLPDGYNTMLTANGGSLSQGQRQLIAIARAAVADPPVMILDEATSSIDTRTEIKIQKAFDTMMRGRTSFIVAHRLSTIREADRILVMRDGHIVEQGKHEELLAKNGFYAKLYQSQFAH